MSVEIRIGVEPGSRDGMRLVLAKIADRVTNVSGLLKNVGEAELEVTRQRFSSKTAPDGSAWPANRPLTLMLAKGGSMMRRSGRLLGSINYQVNGNVLSLGPNTVYAAMMQFGGTVRAKGRALAIPVPGGTMINGRRTDKPGAIFVKQVTIAPRPYIGIGPADEKAIRETVEDWFDLGD